MNSQSTECEIIDISPSPDELQFHPSFIRFVNLNPQSKANLRSQIRKTEKAYFPRYMSGNEAYLRILKNNIAGKFLPVHDENCNVCEVCLSAFSQFQPSIEFSDTSMCGICGNSLDCFDFDLLFLYSSLGYDSPEKIGNLPKLRSRVSQVYPRELFLENLKNYSASDSIKDNQAFIALLEENKVKLSTNFKDGKLAPSKEPELIYCTQRDEWGDETPDWTNEPPFTSLECRFTDGQKFGAVVIDNNFPDMIDRIYKFLNESSEYNINGERSRAKGVHDLICDMLRGKHTNTMDVNELRTYVGKVGIALHNFPFIIMRGDSLDRVHLLEIDEIDPSATDENWGKWVSHLVSFFGQKLPPKPRGGIKGLLAQVPQFEGHK